MGVLSDSFVLDISISVAMWDGSTHQSQVGIDLSSLVWNDSVRHSGECQNPNLTAFTTLRLKMVIYGVKHEEKGSRMTQLEIPKYDDLLWPTLKALEMKGGSASIPELSEQIASDMKLADEVLDVPHKENGTQSEVEYRSAWARTSLKKIGAVENTSRGVWTITERGRQIQGENEVRNLSREWWNKFYQARKAKDFVASTDSELAKENDAENVDLAESAWREKLLKIIRDIEPDAFERLCQRLLRESGFTKVEVTGKSGDGGIDGAGVLRVNLLSFHVRFQCKRYAESVGASAIRDFRGAMVGRADKGLFITTGRFTKDAEREAVRDGAPAIDLIDGLQLCELLKKLELGVEIESVEVIIPDEEFFSAL